MSTFALVLILVLGGERHAFTVDHGLTADDCAQAIAANPRADLSCVLED